MVVMIVPGVSRTLGVAGELMLNVKNMKTNEMNSLNFLSLACNHVMRGMTPLSGTNGLHVVH